MGSDSPPGCTQPLRSIAERCLPLLRTLRTYQPKWLLSDLLAGLALGAVLVPVGLSYAEAAGVPVMAGLYATIGALVGYALFGPSRILVLGPDSALAALIAAAVVPLAHGDPGRTAALAATLAMMVGSICMLFGLAKLGFVTDLLSRPIRYGYLNGIAVTLTAGEIPRLLGLSYRGSSMIEGTLQIARRPIAGGADVASATVGLACITVILLLRRYAPRTPGVLIAMLAAGAAGWWLRHQGISFAPVAATLPSAWTPPHLQPLSAASFSSLLSGAIAIALVSFADISILSRAFVRVTAEETNRNQELFALGMANLLAGLSSGCPVSSSASRTPIAQAAGAQTQLANLVAATSVALLLLFTPSMLAYVPDAALAAIVICAALGIVEVRNVARLYRVRPGEFAVSILCLVGVVLLGVLPGIFISIALAIASFVWRAWHPYSAVLGEVPGKRGYHDVSRHSDAKRCPGLLLFRWDAPLFFANADIFADSVRRAITRSPTPTNRVIIAAEPVTDIDVTAAAVIATLRDDLGRDGIHFCFAELKGPVKDQLRRYGLFDSLGGDACFFATIDEAVEYFSRRHRSKPTATKKPGHRLRRRRRTRRPFGVKRVPTGRP
jgi:high affinity sulfate transporter 1